MINLNNLGFVKLHIWQVLFVCNSIYIVIVNKQEKTNSKLYNINKKYIVGWGD